MSEEFNALLKNSTWELIPSNPNLNDVGCKWVLRSKEIQMGAFNNTKHSFLLKAFSNIQDLIIHKHLVQLSGLLLFE